MIFFSSKIGFHGALEERVRHGFQSRGAVDGLGEDCAPAAHQQRQQAVRRRPAHFVNKTNFTCVFTTGKCPKLCVVYLLEEEGTTYFLFTATDQWAVVVALVGFDMAENLNLWTEPTAISILSCFFPTVPRRAHGTSNEPGEKGIEKRKNIFKTRKRKRR